MFPSSSSSRLLVSQRHEKDNTINGRYNGSPFEPKFLGNFRFRQKDEHLLLFLYQGRVGGNFSVLFDALLPHNIQSSTGVYEIRLLLGMWYIGLFYSPQKGPFLVNLGQNVSNLWPSGAVEHLFKHQWDGRTVS